jgi:hypothetical protein
VEPNAGEVDLEVERNVGEVDLEVERNAGEVDLEEVDNSFYNIPQYLICLNVFRVPNSVACIRRTGKCISYLIASFITSAITRILTM